MKEFNIKCILEEQVEAALQAAIRAKDKSVVFSNEAIRLRGRIMINTDGWEVFYWDDKPVIAFGPIEVGYKYENDKAFIVFKHSVRNF